jgi:hypothetical protein
MPGGPVASYLTSCLSHAHRRPSLSVTIPWPGKMGLLVCPLLPPIHSGNAPASSSHCCSVAVSSLPIVWCLRVLLSSWVLTAPVSVGCSPSRLACLPPPSHATVGLWCQSEHRRCSRTTLTSASALKQTARTPPCRRVAGGRSRLVYFGGAKRTDRSCPRFACGM